MPPTEPASTPIHRAQAHLEWAKHDIAKISDRTIPDWVNAVIYGTAIIFSSFAFVQMLWQRLPPGYVLGDRAVTYCALSLTAKLYLGWFLVDQRPT